uniref:Putative secreted protein n=1 Tax=Ixodes ricinus TaxID=34613 RepID=A0A6B0UUQ5_IXORI
MVRPNRWFLAPTLLTKSSQARWVFQHQMSQYKFTMTKGESLALAKSVTWLWLRLQESLLACSPASRTNRAKPRRHFGMASTTRATRATRTMMATSGSLLEQTTSSSPQGIGSDRSKWKASWLSTQPLQSVPSLAVRIQTGERW